MLQFMAFKMAVGISVLVDFSGVEEKQFHSQSVWEEILPVLVKKGSMKLLKLASHQFPTTLGNEHEIGGTTAFALLEESHISIHTWPEFSKIVVDIFSCNSETNFEDMLEYLSETVPHNQMKIRRIERGI